MHKDVVWHQGLVNVQDREQQNRHKSVVVWFTGLSGSGKSTIAHGVESQLFDQGCRVYVLDGDNIRHGLCADLSFTEEDRTENIRRISEVVNLFIDSGSIILTAFISPYREDRSKVKNLVGEDRFIEIFCDCTIDVCASRDTKGLYKKAMQGEISDFTGISAPYETPVNPDMVIDTDRETEGESIARILGILKQRLIIK
ncbi:MAG TPA: adenylyl-sulfate kinase [Gammaproteobacteria bacterium]|nr:adenylyl-sulfate kinase [Gammaproteobacteria bacterium]